MSVLCVHDVPLHLQINDNTPGQFYASRFMIDSKLKVFTRMKLDYESQSSYRLPIVCQDKDLPLNQISRTFLITVNSKHEAERACSKHELTGSIFHCAFCCRREREAI